MYPDWILQKAKETQLSPQETSQIFMQGSVLRHLSHPEARFMGGTALVMGYQNPRFSEDIDLTQVDKPSCLKPGLLKAQIHMEGWFGCPVSLVPPKAKGQTWKFVVLFGPSESVRLHVDSQPYRAYTTKPLVIDCPPLAPFVCEAVEPDEIMADKIIALAYRNYLGGRDLFDLWFHWLRLEPQKPRQNFILELLKNKIDERKILFKDLQIRLAERLGPKMALARAKEEWQRYLPSDFQKTLVLDDIASRCRKLTEIVL